MTDLSGTMLDDFERRQRSRAAGQAGTALMGASRVSPAAAAAGERAARALGLPPLAVPAPELEARARTQADQLSLQTAPRTAAFLSEPNNAAVSSDIVQPLTDLEALMGRTPGAGLAQALQERTRNSWLGNVVTGMGQRFVEAYAGASRFENTISESILSGASRIGVPESVLNLATGGQRQPAATRVDRAEGVDLGYQAQTTWEDVKARPWREVAPYIVETGLVSLPDMALAIVSLPSYVASRTGSMGQTRAENDERQEATAADLIAALPAAAASAALDRLGGMTFLGLGEDVVQAGIVGAARAAGKAAVVEGVTEGLQEGIESVGETAGTAQGFDLMATLDRMAAGAVAGAGFGGAVRSVTAPVEQHRERQAAARDAQADIEAFDQTVEAVITNPLMERAPERMREYLRGVAGDETIYVPAETVVGFFQSNPDLDHWMDEWDIRDQVEQSVAGADIAFNQADYLAMIAPTEAHAAFRDELRLGLGAMSVREATEFGANGEQEAEAAVTQAADAAQAVSDQASPDQKVYDDVFGQLRAAGTTIDVARNQATLEVARSRTRAARSPDAYADAWAAYQAQPLSIQRAVPQSVRTRMDRTDVMLEALRQGRRTPSQRRMLGSSLMEFVAREGGIVDTGGELAAMGADQWHRQQRFRRRIIRGDDDQGVHGSDYVAARAVEAGFLPEGATGNDLFEAFRNEMAGRPTFSAGFERDTTGEENAAALDDLEATLGLLGVDLAGETNAEIKARLETMIAAAGELPLEQALFQSEPAPPPFYSALAAAVRDSKTARAPADQWKATLAKTPGVKKEEIEWSGVNDWLDAASADEFAPRPIDGPSTAPITDAKGNISREALADFLAGNGVRVDEVVLGGQGIRTDSRFSSPVFERAMAGATTREDAIMQLENDGSAHDVAKRRGDLKVDGELAEDWAEIVVDDIWQGGAEDTAGPSQFSTYKITGADDTYREVLLTLPGVNGPSTHWDTENVVAHARLTTRADADGAKVLFLEEVQSDWHQKGRDRGYMVPASDEERAAAEQRYNEAMAAFRVAGENLVAFARSRAVWPKASTSVYSIYGIKPDAAWNDIPFSEQVSVAAASFAYNDAGETQGREGWSPEMTEVNTAYQAARLAMEEARIGRSRAEGEQGIPDAPFRTSWSALVMKRMIRYAVDNGFDKVAWINGNQQNGGQTGGDGSFFYERNLVNTTNDLIKKYGAKVGPVDMRDAENREIERKAQEYLDRLNLIPESEQAVTHSAAVGRAEGNIAMSRLKNAREIGVQNGFPITDAMRESAGRGFTLFQSQMTGPRGSINLLPDQQVITLMASADRSTFLHEMGHRYLEALIDDAGMDTASDQLKADVAAILGWMNVESVDEVQRDQHEMWAETFEQYLMEGRAPSVELRGAFQRFKAWLTTIYDGIRRRLPNAAISDDVRGVMDRLLATDEEIAAARADTGIEAAFSDAKAAGMTQEAFTAYADAVNRARAAGEDDMLRRTMKAIRREKTAEWNALADEMRPDVAADVDAMPDIAAIRFLSENRMGLSREVVVGMLGDEAGLSLLPRRVPPIVRENGIHPDTVAEAAGYPSGVSLLNGLMEYQVERAERQEKGDKRSIREARIEDTIRERLMQNYGDPLNDGTIEEEALAAIHNDRQAEVLGLETTILGRSVGRNPSPLSILRSWASRHIGQRPISEAKPGRFLQAERRAANAAMKALAADDRAEAFRQKQAQTVNFLLYSEARKARDEVEAAINRMRKLGRKRTVRSMDQDYLDRIHDLLRRYDLTDASVREVRARTSLLEFVREREAAGDPISVPSKMLERAQRQHYSTLTVDEVRELNETVQHLAGLGRLKQRLLDGQAERDLEAVVRDAVEAASPLEDKAYRQGFGPADSWLARTGEFMVGTEASLVKIQAVLRRLDGGGRGVWTRVLDVPGQIAANRLANLRRDFWSGIVAAEKAIPNSVKARWSERLTGHPLINPRNGEPLADLVRRDLIGMARHVGSISNFEKMSKGWGYISKTADEFQVAAARFSFIDYLNNELHPAEWDYVEAWWAAHENQREAYFDNERGLTGIRPVAVEPAPFDAGGKRRAGGYAPISYDPRFDNAAAVREAEDAQDMFGGFTRAPRTSNGAAQDRTGYTGPVNIGLERAGADAHTQMVRIAYGRYIHDALKFIRSPTIRETVRLKAGDAIYNQIEAWLGGQVKDGAVPDPGADWWVKVSRGARTNFSASVLLLSATVLLAQPAGLAASAAAIGPARLAGGIAHAARLAVTGQLHPFIFGKSDYMRLRVEEGGYDRDIRQALLRQPGLEGAKERATLIGAQIVGLVDLWFVSGPTWLAEYNRAIVEGGDDAEAVLTADASVQRTQGGGRPIDMAGIQRGNELTKMLTFAYGWANAHYNLQRDFALDLKAGRNRTNAAMGLFFLTIAAPLADALMSGDWPWGDDDEDKLAAAAAWFMRNVAFGITVGIPVVKDFTNAAERQLQGKYVGPTGQTPLGRVIDSGRVLANDAYAAGIDSAIIAAGGEVEDKEVSRRWPSHVINAVGMTVGVPGTITASRATNYLTDVSDGEQQPESVLDWVNGLLRGPQESQK